MPQEEKDLDAFMSVFVDAHVHIHDCFDVAEFLDAAVSNLRRHGQRAGVPKGRFVLCLTETYGTDKFRLLAQTVESGSTDATSKESGWYFRPSGSGLSVIGADAADSELEIVAGRQIVTAEKLEVLALGSLEGWEDGMPAHSVIEQVLESGAIPVLPWGFGKWLGRRQQVITSLIEKFTGRAVYLGDNGGRSAILPTPPEFALAESRGMRILPGSDPLPFASEYNQAGSYGFRIDGVPQHDDVWPHLCTTLQRGDGDLTPFGNLESPFRFARNQLAMQFKTRVASRKRAA